MLKKVFYFLILLLSIIILILYFIGYYNNMKKDSDKVVVINDLMWEDTPFTDKEEFYANTHLDLEYMNKQYTEGKAQTLKGAIDYCNTLNLANHYDWRLPTLAELKMLNKEKYDIKFKNKPKKKSSTFYWTSTPNEKNTGQNFIISFNRNLVSYEHDINVFYTKCVRNK